MSIELVIGMGALVLAVIAGGWWLRASILKALSRKESDPAMSMLQNQLNANSQQTAQHINHLRDSMQKLTAQMTESLSDTNKTVGERLDNAAKVMQGVSRQLGELEKSTERVFDVGKSISELESILRAPKLRGTIGELLLEDLLSQILPTEHYKVQHSFKGGETVDAVILLQSGMVPVDAKFPLENFKRVTSEDGEDAQKAARKQFVKDVKKHIEAIAEKYIRTDEGTFDFALMYIPAENVYYETIIKEDEQGDTTLLSYALKKRVIPVSPNSFFAYLQTILLGLRGMKVEESAREIINNIARLRKEFERFNDAFRKIGVHLDNSSKQFFEAEKRLGKIEGKMEQIGGAGELSAPEEASIETAEEPEESH